jgi:hypothetical protein
VDPAYIDSFIASYKPSQPVQVNAGDLAFWKARIDKGPESFVNEEKLAAALTTRFHYFNDIDDLKQADSLYSKINVQFKETDPGILLHLASVSMLQHRFREATAYLEKVRKLQAEPYAVNMMLFDADLELGQYEVADSLLKRNRLLKDYAYQFRQSRIDHYKGTLDSSISHMLQAADAAGSNEGLRQAALSNAADLYVHKGALKEAAALYRQCLTYNASDFHSLTGLGWLALVHDHQTTLAETIFSFVGRHSNNPDPVFKQIQAAEVSDPNKAVVLARQFLSRVEQPEYGDMYNKYLIDLYTGVLRQPEKALAIARKEVTNRATPQTYAWLVWSLYQNRQMAEAQQLFTEQVSGRPLEALELYYIGMMMKGSRKDYNATQFLEAALENEYDLSPSKVKTIRKALEE